MDGTELRAGEMCDVVDRGHTVRRPGVGILAMGCSTPARQGYKYQACQVARGMREDRGGQWGMRDDCLPPGIVMMRTVWCTRCQVGYLPTAPGGRVDHG